MSRQITYHIVPGDPAEQLEIEVLDEPGQGGANHVYSIRAKVGRLCLIEFQNGPIGECGVNGITHEALLAIVVDRLESFQKGPYPCNENLAALHYCRAAIEQLQRRTKDRIRRGVEGKNQQ